MIRCLLTAACVLTLSACTAPPQKYVWGNYDEALYQHYKSPANAAMLITSLEASIKKANAIGGKVAPGLYAEYGYLLMTQGKSADAIASFEKEKAGWPESTVFMNRMIQVAQTNPAAQRKEQQ